MSKVILKAMHIVKNYREGKIQTPVLQDADIEINAGVMNAVIGRSGSGKSTLLHILGTLDTPDSGQLFFEEQDLLKLNDKAKSAFRAKNLGFVYQFHHLLQDFTALENVMMPLLIAGYSKKDAQQRALEYLSKVGLSHQLNALPAEMSGGERQRAAIARALCAHPKLILADEPTGNLDAQNASSVFALFKELSRKDGAAVIMVTHDQSLAEQCDEIFTIKEGRVIHA